MWFERLWIAEVNFEMQQPSESFGQAAEVKKSRAFFKVDQNVNVAIGTGFATGHAAEDTHVAGVKLGNEVKNLLTMFDEGPGLRGVGQCGVSVGICWDTNDEVEASSLDQHEKGFCPRLAATSFVGTDDRLGDSRSGGQLGLSEAPELASISEHLGKVHMLNIANTLYSTTSIDQILCGHVLAQ
jgi:hypothetical protein